MLILHKFFYRLAKEGTLPDSFCMVSIMLISKPNKDIKKKKTYVNLLYDDRCKNSKQMEFSDLWKR